MKSYVYSNEQYLNKRNGTKALHNSIEVHKEIYIIIIWWKTHKKFVIKNIIEERSWLEFSPS